MKIRPSEASPICHTSAKPRCVRKREATNPEISPSILALGDEGQLGVKVIAKGNEVEFKDIKIIEDTNEYMLVTGLNEKEKIIIVGQQYVSNGEKVNFE